MLSKIVLKTHINFRFHVVLSLAWFLKSIWSIWWWIQNDNLAFYSWNAHFKNNIFSMWMMFAVRDGRLCTSRALEAFRKLAMMLLWGLQVWIFRGGSKAFSHFHNVISSIARSDHSIVCPCGNPELSILHLFSIFSLSSIIYSSAKATPDLQLCAARTILDV